MSTMSSGLRRRTGWFARVAIVGLLAVLAAGAVTGSTVANHDWRNIHWGVESLPFTLKLGNNVSGRFNSVLNRVARDWRKSDVLNLKVVGGKTNPNTCRATKGRVEVCNGTYGNTGWLGVTGIWQRHGHVAQAVILVNDSYFELPEYDRRIVRRFVLCQEVGHALGLDHDRGRTCMDHRPGRIKQKNAKPSNHDYEQLEEIYDHTDRRSTVKRAVGLEGFSAEESLPTVPTADRSIQGSLIVEDLGNGAQKVTHILWVDELGR